MEDNEYLTVEFDFDAYIIKDEDIDIEKFIKEGCFDEYYIREYFDTINNIVRKKNINFMAEEHINLTMNHYFKKYILNKVVFEDLNKSSEKNLKKLKLLNRYNRKSDTFELQNKEDVYSENSFLVYFNFYSIELKIIKHIKRFNKENFLNNFEFTYNYF